jgi:hypothetical protein
MQATRSHMIQDRLMQARVLKKKYHECGFHAWNHDSSQLMNRFMDRLIAS